MPGISSEAGAGSSSTTLKMPGVPLSMAATVAAAASSMCTSDQMPAPFRRPGSALAQQLGVLAVCGQRGAGPVETAVAQDRAARLVTTASRCLIAASVSRTSAGGSGSSGASSALTASPSRA